MQIEEHVPLAPLTTFHIGGPARFFVRAKTVDEIKEAFAFAKEKNLMKTLLLGGGSNMLINDAGFDGLVIKIEMQGIASDAQDNSIVVAGAGESWDSAVEFAVEHNLWGIENLSGIPGSVGAAPVQNIGAYGAEIKDTLLWIEVLDTTTGEVKRLQNEECGFGYRTSKFKKDAGRFVILEAALKLATAVSPNLVYRDLALVFKDNSEPAIGAIRKAVLTIRAQKFPDIAQEGTAGSFFLNPVVQKEVAEALLVRYPGLVQFPFGDGTKISLAWVLDNVLNLRGLSVGGARLYEKQPLVIVAKKNTSSLEVLELADMVQKKVFDEIGIEIEKEVRVI